MLWACFGFVGWAGAGWCWALGGKGGAPGRGWVGDRGMPRDGVAGKCMPVGCGDDRYCGFW